MNKSNIILNIIKKRFSFLLSDFNADLVKEEISTNTEGVFVTYITEHAGLRVSYEPRDGGIFLMIFPLKNGEIPPYRYWYDVTDYFRLLGVDFSEKRISNSVDPNTEELEREFENFSIAIGMHMKPFFEGDFKLLGELEEIIKRRKKD
jgi:hypothetical protein